MSQLPAPRSAGWIPGVVVLLLGTIFLLHNFDVPVPRLGNIWPWLLIAIGVYKLWEGRLRYLVGLYFLVPGVLFLLWDLDVLPFHPMRLWPVILIAFGLRILRHATGAPRPALATASASSVLRESAVFGGGERRIVSDDFRGGRIDVAFGGLDLDLTGAAIKESPAVIDVSTTFGGVDIRVPTTWSVTLRGASIFGGCDDKTIHPAADSNAPELIVNGTAVFGGCEVKN